MKMAIGQEKKSQYVSTLPAFFSISMPAFADPDCRICTLLLLDDELVAVVVVVVAVPVVEAVVAVADAAEVALLEAVAVALAAAAATALFMIGTRMIFLLGDVAADVVMMVVMLPLEEQVFIYSTQVNVFF